MNNNEQLQKAIDNYLALDQDPVTRKQITDLVSEGQTVELEDRLMKPLTFGTAGLRAEMGGGFNRMNKLTVIQASQGLCSHILKTMSSGTGKPISVVVGFDHRHNSRDFAQLTVSTLVNKGIKVYWFSDITPTPFVPFAINMFGSVAGVMVTASHNPKNDNGYKVYWSNGCQIIPPIDKYIANEIAANQKPWAWDVMGWKNRQDLVEDPLAAVTKAYFEKLAKYRCNSEFPSSAPSIQYPLKIVYTAMHGVGHKFAVKSTACFNLPPMIPVEEQIQPDPDFPTVSYPNPEEGKEALDLAISTSEKNGAKVILANDPDADRLAVAEKQRDGTWLVLTGNQIGIILAHHIFKHHTGSREKVAMLTTLVSSRLLETMAKQEKFHFASTLTGFKFIGNAAIDLEKQGFTVPFAYEEAIGFMVYDLVRDKDGISSLAVFSDLAHSLYSNGKTVSDYLDEIYRQYGYHVTHNGYVVIAKASDRAQVFEVLRGLKAVDFTDKDLVASVGALKSINDFQRQQMMIQFEFERCWVIIRASGTEPKVKYYSEICGSHSEDDPILLKKTLATFIETFFLKFLH